MQIETTEIANARQIIDSLKQSLELVASAANEGQVDKTQIDQIKSIIKQAVALGLFQQAKIEEGMPDAIDLGGGYTLAIPRTPYKTIFLITEDLADPVAISDKSGTAVHGIIQDLVVHLEDELTNDHSDVTDFLWELASNHELSKKQREKLLNKVMATIKHTAKQLSTLKPRGTIELHWETEAGTCIIRYLREESSVQLVNENGKFITIDYMQSQSTVQNNEELIAILRSMTSAEMRFGPPEG